MEIVHVHWCLISIWSKVLFENWDFIFTVFVLSCLFFILLYSRFHRTRRSYVMMTAKLPLSPTRPTAGEGAAKAMFRLVAQWQFQNLGIWVWSKLQKEQKTVTSNHVILYKAKSRLELMRFDTFIHKVKCS